MALLGERFCAVVLGGAIAAPAPTRDPVEVCLAAHERAQLEREADRLVDARAALHRCADDACPPLVRDDCVGWLAEVEAALPAVEIVVLVDGVVVAPEELWIDDVAQATDERTRTLDPGPHRFRVRKVVDGAPREREIERTIEATHGPHVIRIELGVPRPIAAPSAAAPIDRGPDRRTLRIAGWATLGTGLALGALGLGTGTSGLVARRRALDECAPFCASDRADGIRARVLVADIVLPIAAALVVSSIALLVASRRPRPPERAAQQRAGASSASASAGP